MVYASPSSSHHNTVYKWAITHLPITYTPACKHCTVCMVPNTSHLFKSHIPHVYTSTHSPLVRAHEQYANLLPSDSGPKKQARRHASSKRSAASLAAADIRWDVAGIDPSGPKVAFCVTTADNPRQIRHWIAYHRLIGVGHYYLFVDGSANTPPVIKELSTIPGVTVCCVVVVEGF